MAFVCSGSPRPAASVTSMVTSIDSVIRTSSRHRIAPRHTGVLAQGGERRAPRGLGVVDVRHARARVRCAGHRPLPGRGRTVFLGRPSRLRRRRPARAPRVDRRVPPVADRARQRGRRRHRAHADPHERGAPPAVPPDPSRRGSRGPRPDLAGTAAPHRRRRLPARGVRAVRPQHQATSLAHGGGDRGAQAGMDG